MVLRQGLTLVVVDKAAGSTKLLGWDRAVRLPSRLPAPISLRYNPSFPPTRSSVLLLGGRSTVGHMALDHGIGVRIPASQPIHPAWRCLPALLRPTRDHRGEDHGLPHLLHLPQGSTYPWRRTRSKSSGCVACVGRWRLKAERRWRLKNVCRSLPAGSPPIPHDERGHIVALWLADRKLADTAE